VKDLGVTNLIRYLDIRYIYIALTCLLVLAEYRVDYSGELCTAGLVDVVGIYLRVLQAIFIRSIHVEAKFVVAGLVLAHARD